MSSWFGHSSCRCLGQVVLYKFIAFLICPGHYSAMNFPYMIENSMESRTPVVPCASYQWPLFDAIILSPWSLLLKRIWTTGEGNNSPFLLKSIDKFTTIEWDILRVTLQESLSDLFDWGSCLHFHVCLYSVIFQL